MKVFNKFKQIAMMMLIFSLFLITSSVNVYASEITSGIYEVENDVYHESETGMAMSRTYLSPTMTVKVTKNHIIYTIAFSGSEYMENYRMKLNGQDIAVDIVEDNSEDGTVKLNIEVDKVDADMDAVIYIGPMERDVQFKVIPKMETLTLVEAIEEVNEVNAIEKDAEKATNTGASNGEEAVVIEEKDNIGESNEDSSNIRTIAIGVGIVAVTAIIAVAVMKGKNKSL